ncbi:hypothetical protein M3Y99_00146300 [Aphelenchoides fujianensis]|nr:hypothetical protein M3Y99_00146300 [Aphelenchoides fujianensis]
MASSSRKRPAVAKQTAEEPPIVQPASARASGCAKCWKPPAGSSARAAKKKPKAAVEAGASKFDEGIEDPIGSNEFVYQACGVTSEPFFSADGRYFYCFAEKNRLLVVDLYRGTRKLLNAPKRWDKRQVRYYALLNANTIIVGSLWKGPYGFSDVHVHLLRFGPDSDGFTATPLWSKKEGSHSFIISEIRGEQVDVQSAVLGSYGTLHFCRLHLDEPRLEVLHSTETEDILDDFSGHMSADRSEFYAMDEDKPKQLHVYSLAEKKWTKATIKKANWKKRFIPLRYFCTTSAIYTRLSALEDAVFRCTLEAKEWERLPIAGNGIEYVVPLVNPADGADDGLLLVKPERLRANDRGEERYRYTIRRHMLRNVDSLQTLTILATRKACDELEGEENFQQKMAVRPYKVALPSAFEGMEPIPVRCRRCCDH